MSLLELQDEGCTDVRLINIVMVTSFNTLKLKREIKPDAEMVKDLQVSFYLFPGIPADLVGGVLWNMDCVVRASKISQNTYSFFTFWSCNASLSHAYVPLEYFYERAAFLIGKWHLELKPEQEAKSFCNRSSHNAL